MKKTIFLLTILLATAASAFAAPETFKMYGEPHAVSTPGCDVFTSLVLDINGNKGTATLENHVGGFCELYVNPNPRTYNVHLDKTKSNCGSKVYVQGRGVTVTDHSRRVCEDIVPAVIVVQEADGSVLYSQDSAQAL